MDQRPVVFAKQRVSTAELCHEQLKTIVEPANILKPGQGEGRKGRCVRIIMQRVNFIQEEARRQGNRVYLVDVDFKNAFNAMSQAAFCSGR